MMAAMSSRRRGQRCVAVTRAGLETVLAGELAALGLRPEAPTPGAVGFTATPRQLLVAVRLLRTATRVLVDVATVRARTFGLLERGLAEVPWATWVAPGAAVAVRARSEGSRLYHTGAVAERVAAAIAGAVPDVVVSAPTDTTVRVDVRVVHDVAVIRLDATGVPADRRGWRLEVAKAPLPPTVAAAVLRAIGWDGTTPLLDPLCGSGTIPIEAALLAAARPPAVERPFAVQSWAGYAPGTWASAGAPSTPAHRPRIRASDRDAGAVVAALANAERAGVADLVDVRRAPLGGAADALPADEPGWVVTNPPWGHRVDGGGDLRDLHAALGALVAGLDGWRLAVVTADPALARHTGLDLQAVWRTTVGGQAVTLLATP